MGSNSHTVVLSKPVSYSPALFSVPVKIREHAYQCYMVVYGTGKVRWLCGYSTLAGAVKVPLRYGGSTRKVRCTYSLNTVKVQSSMVKVQYYTETLILRLLYFICSIVFQLKLLADGVRRLVHPL